jgi:hypothetical protein
MAIIVSSSINNILICEERTVKSEKNNNKANSGIAGKNRAKKQAFHLQEFIRLSRKRRRQGSSGRN